MVLKKHVLNIIDGPARIISQREPTDYGVSASNALSAKIVVGTP
jgi:hypothetical protein